MDGSESSVYGGEGQGDYSEEGKEREHGYHPGESETDYDPLEGDNVDDAIAKILADN